MAERFDLGRVVREAARAAATRPTPFYLYDGDLARAWALRWRQAADRSGFELFYPYKCNRHPALAEAVAAEGLGAEVAVPTDLASALARGLPGERLVFQGPAKTRDATDLALAAGAWLAADSAEDARAILERGRALRIAPRYLLRFRPAAAEPAQHGFGMSRAEILALARRIQEERWEPPRGLAFHLGTGMASAGPYLGAVQEAGRLAEGLASRGIRVEVLDVGGGFAARGESRRDSRGRPRPPAPPVEVFLRRMSREARRVLPGARLFAEPGRAIAADAFALVARVLRVRGRRVYIDASRVSHALFVPRGRHSFRPVPPRRGGRPCEIAGPLAVDLDVLSAAQAVGRPREGDLMVIGSVGAYNLIAANAWAGEAPVVEMGGR